MIDLEIVGLQATKYGYTHWYHPACLMRLKMFDDPIMPDIDDCEVVVAGDPRERESCSPCGRPLCERSAVRGGLDEEPHLIVKLFPTDGDSL